MLHLSSLSKSYGERVLFSDVNLFINKYDRIGLVGSNGSGKTTFLKIICDIENPSTGTIYRSSDITFGYLPQENNFDSNNTLFSEALLSFKEINVIQREIEILHKRLIDGPEDKKLLEKLGYYEHRLQDLEISNINTRIKIILNGLGFKEKDYDRKVQEFSGGWKMRLLLTKILLSEPGMLLLDEPTNHLDLESLEWLEDYLMTFKGAIILVSHDKSFLDNIIKRTLELYSGKINDYKGNYSFYVTEKEKKNLSIKASFKHQREKIKKIERFIERFRYKATKAKQVQSRIKFLEKMDIVDIENEEDTIDFSFPEPPSSGRVVCNLDNLTKMYNDLKVFDKVNLSIERGDRIAVVGPNGAGKSTLLRILADLETISDGKMEMGYNVARSYFAQEQIFELNETQTIFETIDQVAVGDIRKRIRTLLGSFLFSDDEAFKSISILSGGEKSRVALAKMLLTPANFLIMDEPTNHLDIKSKEILQTALKNYNGTYIIASHDRDFLNPIINKVFEVKNETIRIFPGNLSEYSYHRRQNYEIDLKKDLQNIIDDDYKKTLPSKDRKRLEADFRQKKYILTKPLKDKIEKIEIQIIEIEEIIRDCEHLMSDPNTYKDSNRVKSLNIDYIKYKENLEKIYKQWEISNAELEELELSLNSEIS